MRYELMMCEFSTVEAFPFDYRDLLVRADTYQLLDNVVSYVESSNASFFCR